MADLSEKLKRIREIRCECVDETTLNPNQRTQAVLEFLSKQGVMLDNWTLICFSIYYLASQLAIVPDLKHEVESLALKLLRAHYFSGGDFGLYDENAIQQLTHLKLEKEPTLKQNDVLDKPEGSE